VVSIALSFATIASRLSVGVEFSMKNLDALGRVFILQRFHAALVLRLTGQLFACVISTTALASPSCRSSCECRF